MTSDPFDVVIVGAGPAGSATAIHLSGAGHRVLVLDRASFPRDKPCSEFMSPATVGQLVRIGALDPVSAPAGSALAGTAVSGPDGSRLLGRFANAAPRWNGASGLAMPRRALDAAIFAAARRAGADTGERLTVVDLLRDGGMVTGVKVRDEAGAISERRARAVVGADGLGSVVARRAGLLRHGRLRRVAFVAHVAGVSGLGTTAELHVGRGGYVGLNPLGDDVANVALVVPARRATEARGDAAGFFHRTLLDFPAVAGRVDTSRIVRPVLVTGPFASSSRSSVADGVLLVGDAADFFDPFTGEGIWSALRGAELAAETLDHALRRPGAITASSLRRYRTLRRRAFLGKWVIERLIGYGMLAPALFDRAIARLERRGMADTLIGVTGSLLPPSKVLNPVFLARMVL